MQHMKMFFRRTGKVFADCGRRVWIFIGSKPFFWIILGLFTAQALWVAWSGLYSMAFDEFFHYGLIQEYAKGWTPFIAQPAGPAVFGAVARDPSFLYHYLMSFPYHLIAAIWHTELAQILVLRVLNVALFIGGLVMYWKLIMTTGLSRRTANIIMLFFTLVPTVVVLAPQINYDNMTFLASGAIMLLAAHVIISLHRKKIPEPATLTGLVALLLAGSIVKYTLLPLTLTVGAFVTVRSIISLVRKDFRWRDLTSQYRAYCKRPLGIALVGSVIIIAALFTQRIVVNVVRYGTPAPDCQSVLSLDQCLGHAAYARNERYQQKSYATKITDKDKQLYPKRWYRKMLKESFFAVGPRELDYPAGYPLPTAYQAGRIIIWTMAVLVAINAIWLWRKHPLWQLFLLVSIVYGGTLYLFNYSEYLRLGVVVAIHGRYIIYIMPVLAALAAASLGRFIGIKWRWAVHLAVLPLLIMMLYGGGMLPFIIRSADTWMFPHAVQANNRLRSFLWEKIPQDYTETPVK